MKHGLLSTSLFSLLLACTVGLFVPVDLYVNNQSSTTIDLYSIFAGSLPFIVLFPVASTLVYWLLHFSSARLFFAVFTGTVSICAWLNSTFLFGSYGQIDGRGLSIDAWSPISWAQIALFFIVIFVLYTYRKSNLPRNIALSIILIGTLSTSLNIVSFFQSGGHLKIEAKATGGFNQDMLAFSKEKNIIHIILDELQADVFESVIEKNKSIRDVFDGFIFFPDTISAYPTTVMSLPSMFTGKVYENNGGRREFIKTLISEEKTLPLILGKEGYTASMHGGCDGIFSSCSPSTEKTLNKSSLHSLGYIQLIDLSLFRASPDLFKEFIYSNEKWFVQRFLFKERYAKTSYVGLAHKIFGKYNQDVFLSKSSSPTYKVFHSVITHSPIWLDADCQPHDDPAPHTLENRSNEALCALRHTRKLIDKIKEMGIYNDTMIIISSDHGSSYYPESIKSQFQDRGIPYSTASSTLLIKPFHSEGALKVDNYPATLIDIPATILGALNIESDLSSINLLSDERPITRDRRYLYYLWNSKYEKENKLPPLYTYAVAQDAKKPGSWVLLNSEVDALKFAASNLPSQTGTLEGDFLVASGKAGFVTFGPYTLLPKGKYKISINYRSQNEPSDAVGWWDAVSSKGVVKHHKGVIYGTAGEEAEVGAELILDASVNNFEVRTYFSGKGSLAVKAIKIDKDLE